MEPTVESLLLQARTLLKNEEPTRVKALVITKIEEALLWLDSGEILNG